MSQRPKYSKEGGTASINGHYYEIKTCALMYLLALNSESEDFLIASNFKALEEKNVGHDFQDLGLMFIDKEVIIAKINYYLRSECHSFIYLFIFCKMLNYQKQFLLLNKLLQKFCTIFLCHLESNRKHNVLLFCVMGG